MGRIAFAQGHYPHTPGYQNVDTSFDAAVAIEESAAGLQALVLVALREHGPMTTDQTAGKMGYFGLDVLKIRPRFSELKKMNKVEMTDERRKNESGQSARVWRLK